MFITEGKLPDHYSALPTFWPEVVSAACQVRVPPSKTPAAAAPYKKSPSAEPLLFNAGSIGIGARRLLLRGAR